MKHITDARGSSRHAKITILIQFRASDEDEVTKGLLDNVKNLRFATVLDIKRARSDEIRDVKILHFAPVLDVRRARSDEKGLLRNVKTCMSLQF